MHKQNNFLTTQIDKNSQIKSHMLFQLHNSCSNSSCNNECTIVAVAFAMYHKHIRQISKMPKLDSFLTFLKQAGSGISFVQSCSMVWYGISSYGMGKLLYGIVWYIFVWYGLSLYCMLWYGMVYLCMLWYIFVRYG